VGDAQKLGYRELLAASKAAFEEVPDFTVAVEEEFALPAEERRELGLAARRAVERNWSWARIAERLLL